MYLHIMKHLTDTLNKFVRNVSPICLNKQHSRLTGSQGPWRKYIYMQGGFTMGLSFMWMEDVGVFFRGWGWGEVFLFNWYCEVVVWQTNPRHQIIRWERLNLKNIHLSHSNATKLQNFITGITLNFLMLAVSCTAAI